MLDLNAFHHLPQLDALFDEITHDDSGMVVVTGLEARPELLPSTAAASGSSFIFGILARQIINAHRHTRVAVVTPHKEPLLRLSTRDRARFKLFTPKPEEAYAETMSRAVQNGYPVLLAEKVTRACAVDALAASVDGHRSIVQMDTPLHGCWLARYLNESLDDPAQLQPLHWIIAVRRMSTLCEFCKKHDGEFWNAPGCEHCDQSGRRGEIALFDVWRPVSGTDPLMQASVLSFDNYARELAQQGFLARQDTEQLDAAQLYRTFHLLTRSETHSVQATQTLKTQVAELDVAKRALEQQYRTSIALQEMGHKLLELDSVEALASYICAKARELCGADRAVLYLFHADGTSEIAALNGWDPQWLHSRVSFQDLVHNDTPGDEPSPFVGYPPGIPTRVADLEGAYIRAGLHVPLIAQREVLGAMIFHSTVRKTFEARDAAILQALANAGAAAIQRADLIENLRDKVEQLQAAQGEIAQKERLERELELARQVQQNMLPHIFPLLPGVTFYARNEPARQVGGDFYDVFVLDADRIGLVIADVSDKGMPAALFMALTRSLVRAEAQREPSPRTVLRRVHRLLLEVAEPTQFVTLFYGVLDLTARTLTYVRAGHDYPMLVRGDIMLLLKGAGTVLGLLDDAEVWLSEEVVPLEHGDRLVLYTDGLTDTMNPAEDHFGRDRLQAAVLAARAASVDRMGESIFDAVLAYQSTADQFDDMTLLIVNLK